jgi:hypothetical protein
MNENEKKYQQSFRNPFFQLPLVSEFEFKAISPSPQAFFSGSYGSNYPIDQYTHGLLEELVMPQAVRELGHHSMIIAADGHHSFWKNAKEDTSCYPSSMSFSTMTAGACNDTISTLDCTMVSIPLKSGYSPQCWNNCMEVIIQKKLGLTHLSALHASFLFPVDYNYAFNHIGREMMRVAKCTKTLAPEQYGSRKEHKAMDSAVNKALTYDLLCQLKRTEAVCSNNTESCYYLISHTQASVATQ